MSTPTNQEVLHVLRAHGHCAELADRVAAVALAAAAQRRAEFLTGETVAEGGDAFPPLDPEAADTSIGNVLAILDRGAGTRVEWLLVSAGLSYAVASRFDATNPQILRDLGWLAANTPCNAWLYFDDCIPAEQRQVFWAATQKAWQEMPRAEQTAVVLGSRLATSDEAVKALADLFGETEDPVLASLLGEQLNSRTLVGELAPARSGPIVTILLTFTGLLSLRAIWRAFARYVLGARRRARLTIGATGVRLEHEYSMLGRRLRQGEKLVPLGHVVSLERETRYSGVALYAGLFALTLGTYLGTTLLVDGARVAGGSLSLFGLGAGLIALGVVLDFVLARSSDLSRGTVSLSLRTRQGQGFVLRNLETVAADAALRRVRLLVAG